MKTTNAKFAGLLLLGGSLFMVSCGKKGCTDPNADNYDSEATVYDGSCTYTNTRTFVVNPETIGSTEYKEISGTINEDYTLTAADNWLLSGGVFVDDGATLTIEAGTKIFAADDGTTPFLSIKQGGMINAVGTADNPIVFTSVKSSPAPGDWGGIIINGKADINTGETAEGEGGTGIYGGADDADNSGTIKYVRVEYAGKILGTDNELNGFSFNGVGSGTTIEYIQAFKGSDDGIEFFGGTVTVKYAVSTGNEDDSFDWTHGWRGTGQYWYVEQDANGDRGIEADNNGDDNTKTPFSNPTLSNVTLIGIGGSDGMKLREGTKGTISNVTIDNFKDGVEVQHGQTVSNAAGGSLSLSNIKVTNASNNFVIKDAANSTDSTNAATNVGAAIGTTATGSGTSWMSGWTKAL